MKSVVASVLVGVLLLAGLVAVVSAQGGDVLARVEPLLVSVRQQVPVSVTLSIPLDDGETQTVTVPMALDLNLEIALSSTMSPVVSVAASEPTVTVATVEGDQVDDLGLPFVLDVADPDRVDVVEWTAYADLNGRLAFAGAVENVGEEEFSLVDVVVRFYAEDGALVEVVNGVVSGRFIKPGARSPFQVDTYLPADAGFDRYAVDVSVVD